MPDDEKWKEYSRRTIPTCGASVSAVWNKTLGNYIIECGGCIGKISGFLKNDSRDFYIERYESNEKILTGECKCYSEGVGIEKIQEAITQLCKYDTELNLIIVNRLKDIRNWKNVLKMEYDENEKSEIYVLEDGKEIKHCCSIGIKKKMFLIIDIESLKR